MRGWESVEFRVRGFEVRGSVRSAECGVGSFEFRVRGTEFGVPVWSSDLELELIPHSELRTRESVSAEASSDQIRHLDEEGA